MAAFTEKLKADPTELSGHKVAQVVRTDGLKLILADARGFATAYQEPSRWFGPTPKRATSRMWRR